MRRRCLPLCAAVPALIAGGTWAADGIISLPRVHETERLQLESAQRQYQERLKPLPPRQQQELEMRLHRQRVEQRRLHQEQQQREQALERRRRSSAGDVTGPAPGHRAQQQQFQRERDSQRLRFEIQRDSWPYPKRQP